MPTWVALALCSMFFAGLTSVIAKFGLKNISGDLAVVVRTAVVLGLVVLNFWVFTGLKVYVVIIGTIQPPSKFP
jgi:bacterial/archaeal transporter family protein